MKKKRRGRLGAGGFRVKGLGPSKKRFQGLRGGIWGLGFVDVGSLAPADIGTFVVMTILCPSTVSA